MKEVDGETDAEGKRKNNLTEKEKKDVDAENEQIGFEIKKKEGA